MKNDLTNLSAVTLARKISNKELSPVEVVNSYLDRIEDMNPKINAFCTVVANEAREAAYQAEKAVQEGKKLGALHGIPVAIKDMTPTKNIRTTFGSKVYADHVPERDAVIVKRIKDAGGIILGKTNTPEFAHKGTTDNQLFGTTKHPHHHELTSGGSSGGSAAAVAARLVPLAEGSDGGGSIRIPASFCGVFGLKPTYGRIPYDAIENNMFSSQNPFLHYGPISRTAEDSALLLSVMSGFDPIDPYVSPDHNQFTVKDTYESAKDLRIAYSQDLGIYEIDPAVKKTMQDTVTHFTNLGFRIEEIDLDLGLSRKELNQAFSTLWITQIATNYRGLVPRYEHLLTDDIRKIIHIGQKIRAVDYKDIERTRTEIWNKIQKVFMDYDLLVCPTLAVPPFSNTIKGPSIINEQKVDPNLDWMLTTIFNLTGHPAASIPAKVNSNELPVGIQVIARRFEEKNIFRLAYSFEQSKL